MITKNNNSHKLAEEYDHYPVPPYDPSLSHTEREALRKEAETNLEETLKNSLERFHFVSPEDSVT